MHVKKDIKIVVLYLFLGALVACTSKNDKSSFLFEALDSDKTNIHFKNSIPEDKLTNSFIYEYVYNGGGVAVGDINNDGLADIYFTSNLHTNKLYLNRGNFQFKDITEISKTPGKRGWTTGTNMVDINNDGLLDIYVCKSGPYESRALLENELYINKGPNKEGIPIFEEMAAQYGLDAPGYSIQSAFLDFDNDGDLDMYLMNHNPQTFAMGSTETPSPLGDKFYANINGKFVDRTAEVGIYSNAVSYGLGVGVGDLNLDGWPDIYVSNDYDEPDYLYLNQKDGTFKEVAKKATNHLSNFSMGNDIADFDNDGFMDILTLDMVSEDNYGMKTSMASMNPEKFSNNVKAGKHYQYMYNTFQKHSTHIDSMGIPFFSDIGQMTGMSNTDWSWAPLMADFDNDGLKDVFITNGIKRDFRNKDYHKYVQSFMKSNPDALSNPKKINGLVEGIPNRPNRNYFYRNNGGLDFTNMSDVWMDDAEKGYSNGAAYADLDNDGDLDLVINNVDAEATVLRNNSEILDYGFLQLDFKGPPGNALGIGVKVEVFAENEKQVFENYSVRGYQSSVPPGIHMGLGKMDKIDSILVFWPSHGNYQKIENPEINQKLTITYDPDILKKFEPPGIKKRLFVPKNILNHLKHVENDFDDYEHQVLLPHKMSQFGPAIAVGDVNGDGKDDLYLGQSAGEISKLYRQTKNGIFEEYQSFDGELAYEDVDAEFLDFDQDGDMDLFVASGGNEFEPNSINYADRLYENKAGKFTRRSDLFPKNIHISSSRIRVKDYNEDGFPDVFVGGRHVAQDYPSPADSYLLKNEKGKFVDVTAAKAPDLKELGLVTDASWSDFDSDGDMDLLVVGEWMAPVILENRNNSFQRIPSKYLDSLAGWYFTIEPLDIDRDGDDDYILGNLGQNYKYKASLTEPFEIFYNDFDTNGKKDIVLGYYNFGELFPVRGKECSSQQMPEIKKIIPTYHEFGKSSVRDIYGRYNISEALHLSAYNFKSGILKNNGNGQFSFVPLPEYAQMSSINDVLSKDLDKDGDDDLIIAGNLFTSEIETPRNDAGYGLVLLSKGNFTYDLVNAHESGLFLPKDVKNLQILKINGTQHILAGNNDDEVNLYSIDLRNQE
jgi:hypothetical protein